ncbi:MAG: DUF2953 domain-containing protein [Syntrophomonadaceae bacterium]
MPIGSLVLMLLILLAIIIILHSYYKVQVIVNLASQKSEQVLAIEIIPPRFRPRRQYHYSRQDLIDIVQKSLVFKLDPTRRVFGFIIRTKYPVHRLVSRYTIMEKIDWKTRVGVNDAMYTGITTGLIWALKGIVVSMAGHRSRLQSLSIDVQPDFAQAVVNSRLICILKIRIVHIIIIFSYAFALKVRRYINGYGTGSTAKSPN